MPFPSKSTLLTIIGISLSACLQAADQIVLAHAQHVKEINIIHLDKTIRKIQVNKSEKGADLTISLNNPDLNHPPKSIELHINNGIKRKWILQLNETEIQDKIQILKTILPTDSIELIITLQDTITTIPIIQLRNLKATMTLNRWEDILIHE
jgi:hypothetical protein